MGRKNFFWEVYLINSNYYCIHINFQKPTLQVNDELFFMVINRTFFMNIFCQLFIKLFVENGVKIIIVVM